MTKRKFQPTEEQKARAEARRRRFRELINQVASMTDEERQALVESVGQIPTCEGRSLSPYNTCLVITQCPRASMVGGFRQWLAAGRAVRKGETGLMIWVPRVSNREEIAEGAADEAEIDFLMGTVFDVSQTVELTAKTEIAQARTIDREPRCG